MKKMLKWLANELNEAGIEYHLNRNGKSKPTYPYFVGELFPVDPVSESGMQEYSLLLDGFTRSTLTELLECAEQIEERFPRVEGNTAILENNQAVAAYFSGCQPVETGEEQLKRVTVTITIKTWKER